MTNRTITFSVKPSDTVSQALIVELRAYSIRSGIKFSRICIDGLKMYKEANDVEIQRRAKA